MQAQIAKNYEEVEWIPQRKLFKIKRSNLEYQNKTLNDASIRDCKSD
jgi:hypothetical protein